MNSSRLRNLALLKHSSSLTMPGRICRGASAQTNMIRSASTYLLRRPIPILCPKVPMRPIFFRRHYSIEEEKIEDVTSLEDLLKVDTALEQMISAGANIAEVIRRQNDNIKVGSEIAIHAVYDSLLDVTVQFIANTYPGGVHTLRDYHFDVDASFPTGMDTWVTQIRHGLEGLIEGEMQQSSLEEAIKRTSKLFEIVEKGHSELGMIFGSHHENLNEIVHKMQHLLKRAERANAYLKTTTTAEENDLISYQQTSEKEWKELKSAIDHISSLTDEIWKWKSERTRLEKPRNFGEGVWWGFFGAGAIESKVKREKLSGSIVANESKIAHERELQSTHQARFEQSHRNIENAKLTLEDLAKHKTSINENVKALKDVIKSSQKTLRFVVDRKHVLSRIETDLVSMARFASIYERYSERVPKKNIAGLIIDVFDKTPDWPSTTIPVLLSVMLLRWPPSALFSEYENVLGEEDENIEIKTKFDRVIERASRNYMLGETTNSVPRLDQYLHNIEFDWEFTFLNWNNLIQDSKKTEIKPAPVA